MQALIIFGTSVGFLIGMASGIANENSWSSVIWRSCVAACATGLMFQWWVKMISKNLKLAQEERLANSMDETALSNPVTPEQK